MCNSSQHPSLPLVTRAMHYRRNAPVEEAIARLESGNVKGASDIVSSATGIGLPETTEIRVLSSAITASAPLRTGNEEKFSSAAAPTSASAHTMPLLSRQSLDETLLRHSVVPALHNCFSDYLFPLKHFPNKHKIRRDPRETENLRISRARSSTRNINAAFATLETNFHANYANEE